jgi:type I restriction enzyme S subunit
MNFILYKEASFKKTPIGKIPKDWDLAKLSDTAEDIYYGITAKAVENNTGLKMLRTTDIKDYTVDWDSLPFCEVTEKRGDIQRFLLKKEDLIIARAGTTGVSVLVEKDFENVVFGSYLIKVRLNRKVLPKFMRYFCQSHLYWDHITSSQAGSTLKNISLPVLKSLNIPLPSSIEEQQNIAEVLSMVDEAIRKTNEIIGKTERLKKGLMQELLTKGIGHKEFKDTEIGRIPKDWRIVELGETVEINKESIDPIKEIPNKTFIYIDIDVIMSTVRPYLKAFAVVPKEYDNQICSTGFAVLTCKNLILPYFLLSVLFSDSVIAQCNRMMVGGQYPALNQSQVSRIKIPLPPLLEQQRITEILSAIDQKLEIERKEKTKLERIKQGLMDLLLTGKIRVKVGQ